MSGSHWLSALAGGVRQRLAAPGSVQLRLHLLDRDGRDGPAHHRLPRRSNSFPAETDDGGAGDRLHRPLTAALTQDRDRTTFILAAPLAHCYDRETTRV